MHVSKDLLGRSARSKNEKHMRLMEAALRTGRSVVVDNTNPRPGVRAPLLEGARRVGATTVGILVAAPVADCLRRNAAREGKARVPAVVIHVAAEKLVPPSREEGFDEVLEARILDDGSWSVGALLPQT